MKILALALVALPFAASAATLGRSYMSPTATGSGTAMVSFSGGGQQCQFTYAQFLPVSGTPGAPASAAPKGVAFPHGVFDFAVSHCEPGSALEFTITYPRNVAGATYWKFGPTLANPRRHWHSVPAKFEGGAVSFTIVDGGMGDDDLKRDGRILDPGGPGMMEGAGDGMALGPWPLWLLVTMMGVVGLHPAPRRLIADGVAKTLRKK